MSEKLNEYTDADLAIKEAKPKLRRPPLYKVVLINDDFTPMEFVVHILEFFFLEKLDIFCSILNNNESVDIKTLVSLKFSNLFL